MGTITVTGALVVIIGWITLVEFDQSSEQERKRILDKIKNSPMSILIISLMPIGIIVNLLGSYMASLWMVMVGASLILLQGIIVSFLFWNRKRWKSIFLLIVVVGLGSFLYIPLIIH